MNNLNKYPAYKASGVEWLGDVPEHWEVKRVKSITRIRRGASPRPIADPRYFSDNGEYSWVRIADVTANNHYLLQTKDTLSKLGASLSVKIHKGELFLSIAGSVGKPMIAKIKCCIHDGFVYFPDLKDGQEFLYRIFETGRPYVGLGKHGTQLNLNTETIGNIKIPVPPKEEQTKIANYLDRKTAQIDQAIAQKEQLIELLKERQQILIHQAVTQGLDDSVEMRNSGVEWIGQVPKHWEVKKLKYVAEINKNSLDENTNKDFEFNYVDIGSVSFENGVISIEKYIFKNAPSRARRLVQEGDTIISTVRTYLKAIDFISKNKSKHVYSTGFAILTPKKFIYPQYLALAVKDDSFTNQVTIFSKGMSYPAINSTDLSRLHLVHPPIEEQKQIANHIDMETKKIQTAIGLKTKEIARLKEYKTVLIDAAVTGKVFIN